jgi:proline-specific peptidase
LSSKFSEEGFVPYEGYKIWYGISGENEEQGKHPLLCLHGGPGASHDYLKPLNTITKTGRRVIFYDQLGAGNSDHPNNPKMWTVKLYVKEVDVIRNALGLEKLHILGQSWGGQLALEYALTQPKGLVSIILADSLSDMAQWISEANRLRNMLPQETLDIMIKHESEGTLDDPAYEEASMEYYRRHVCRLPEWPEVLNKSFQKLEQHPQVYHTMWGPNEFIVSGILKDWSVKDRLGEIRVPTLILSGRYDESTPLINETMKKGIKNSEWVVFENSSHTPHLEEPEKYHSVLKEFLERIETS